MNSHSLIQVILNCAIGYYAFVSILCWLLALASKHLEPMGSHGHCDPKEKPLLVVVVPCRDASESVPGLVQCLRRQNYPADRFRIILVADNCIDASARTARSFGIDVFERHQSLIKTKGAALNELLGSRLKYEPFDGLLLLDVDARIPPDFLTRAEDYLIEGSDIVQSAVYAKSSGAHPLQTISEVALSFTHRDQRGRAALGWNAIIQGPGLILSRHLLMRLDWQLSIGHYLSTDLATRIRCCLAGIPIRYAPDLAVVIDLPEDAPAVRSQRARWGAGALELALPFGLPLLRRGMAGDWRAFDMLHMLISPPISILFLAGALGTVTFAGGSIALPWLRTCAYALTGVWMLHCAYYLWSFRTLNRIHWKYSDVRNLAFFMKSRVIASLQAIPLAFQPRSGERWIPMSHGKDNPDFPGMIPATLPGTSHDERGIESYNAVSEL